MMNMLIVDDDHNIRSGLKVLIDWDELGVTVIGEAENGAEALRLIEEHQPQLLLTDVRMPRGGGLELIESLRAQGNPMQIVVLSGYNDFAYIRQALKYDVEDYLLKPVDPQELKEVVKTCCAKMDSHLQTAQLNRESRRLLRNNTLLRWVENRIDAKQLREKLQFVDLHIAGNLCQAAVISWREWQDHALGSAEEQFRSFAISNVVEECMQRDGKGICFVNNDKQVVCLFIGSGDSEPNAFARHNREWLAAIADQYAPMLKTPWFCTLGNAVTQAQHVHQSYQKAVALQHYIDFTGPVTCIDETVVVTAYDGPIPSLPLQESIASDLQAGRRDGWLSALQADFQWALLQRSPLSAAKEAATEWIVLLKQIGKQTNLRTELTHYRSIGVLLASPSIDELRQRLLQLLFDWEKEFAAWSERRGNSVIAKLEQFVSDRLEQEMTLQLLAKQFNFNAIYLGKLFKDETGEYFSDYLNRMRMNRAKQLLRENTLKTYEIAGMVGYKDTNYFFRKFKQHTGLTPSEFRHMPHSPGEYNQ